MTKISLVANDQLLLIGLQPELAAGDVNSVELHVDFSAEWDGFARSAVFHTSNDPTKYEMILTDGNCMIPHEVLAESGILYIGVRGVNSDNNSVKTSSLVRYNIVEGTEEGDGETTEPPTAGVYQQLLTAYGLTDNALAVERARIDSMIASGKTDGLTSYDFTFTDGSGTERHGIAESNGVIATIGLEEFYMSAGQIINITLPREFSASHMQLLERGMNIKVTVFSSGGFQLRNLGDGETVTSNFAGFHYPLSTISIPEINDARVGTDGTIYDSIGIAFREQISALMNRIESLEAKVNE